MSEFLFLVNSGQACFEALTHIVRRVQLIDDVARDQHNRNSLLTQYIAFTCALPHADPTPGTILTFYKGNRIKPSSYLE